MPFNEIECWSVGPWKQPGPDDGLSLGPAFVWKLPNGLRSSGQLRESWPERPAVQEVAGDPWLSGPMVVPRQEPKGPKHCLRGMGRIG